MIFKPALLYRYQATILLFAAANEPNGDKTAQVSGPTSCYQRFVNVVLSKGGNNTSRWLVVQEASTANGAKVDQWTAGEGTHPQWKFQ